MSEVGYRRVDISALKALPKTADQERKTLIAQLFPSVVNLNWDVVFNNDIDLLGRVIRDKLISERAVPGKPGRRKTELSRADIEPIVDRIRGRNPVDRPYALQPFPEAFRMLAGKASVRSIENKTGIPKTWVHKLLSGACPPSLEDIEKVATAYKKAPTYFLEYRIQMVTASVEHYLQSNPEESIRYFEGLFRVKGKR